MEAFLNALKSELKFLFSGKGMPYEKVCLLVAMVVTVILSVLLSGNFAKDAKVVVIDLDNSAYTRELITRIDGRFQLIRFSVFAMFRHMPTTLLLTAFFLVCFLGAIIVPIGLIFMPGLWLYGYSFFVERILRKYMTQEMRNLWDGEEAFCGQE